MLGLLLGHLGCRVIEAANGAAALQSIASASPLALAIVDLRLSNTSGVAVIRELRLRLGNAAPPFVVFSGSLPAAPPEGVVAMIQKPATTERLLAIIKEAIAPGRRATDASNQRQADENRKRPPSEGSAAPWATREPVGASAGRSGAVTKPALRRTRRPARVVEHVAPATARDPRRER